MPRIKAQERLEWASLVSLMLGDTEALDNTMRAAGINSAQREVTINTVRSRK